MKDDKKKVIQDDGLTKKQKKLLEKSEAERIAEEKKQAEQLKKEQAEREKKEKQEKNAKKGKNKKLDKLPDEGGKKKKKKKKHRGCIVGCLVAIKNFVIFLIIFNLIIGTAAYFVGDYYAKQYLDMSASEIFGVIKGLATSDADRLVGDNEKFTEADLDGFYRGLERQLFLSSEAKLRETLENAIISQLSSGDSDASTSALKPTEGEGGENGGEGDSGEIPDFLKELLVAKNFDLLGIANFDYDNPTAFTDLALTDKQIGAFLNSIFTSPDVREYVTDMLAEPINEAIKSAGLEDLAVVRPQANLRVLRVVFYEDDDTVYDENGQNPTSATVTKIRLSVAFEFRELIRSIFDSFGKGYGFGAGILIEDFILTAEIGLTHNCIPRFYINNMDAVKMANLYKLVENVTGLIGDSMDLEKTIRELGTNSIYPIIKSVNDIIPLDNIREGAFRISPFDMILNMAFSGQDGAYRPEARDLFLFLKSLLIVKSDAFVTSPYKQTFYKSGGVNGTEAVVLLTDEAIAEALAQGHITVDQDGNYVFADHLDVLKDLLLSRYYVELGDIQELLDFVMGTGSSTTTDDDNEGSDPSSVSLPTSDSSEDEDDILSGLLGKFNTDNFRDDYLSNKPIEEINQPIFITDFMLAALIDYMFTEADMSKFGVDMPFDMSAFSLEQAILAERGETNPSTFLTMTISVSIVSFLDDFMEDNSFVFTFLKELIREQFPEKFYLTMVVDVTQSTDPNYERKPSYIQINNLGEINEFAEDDENKDKFSDLSNPAYADNVWSMFESLAGIDFNDIADQMADAVNGILDSMSDVMPVSLAVSGIKLPGFYDFVIDLMAVDIDDNGTTRPLTTSELRQILKSLDMGSKLSAGEAGSRPIDEYLWNVPSSEVDELNGFFRDFEDKYYIAIGTFSYDFTDQNIIDWKVTSVLTEQGLVDTDPEWQASYDALKAVYSALTGDEKDEFIEKTKKEMLDASIGKLLDGGSSELFSEFSALRTHTDGAYAGLFDDNRDFAELQVEMTDKALLALIKNQLTSGLSSGADEGAKDMLDSINIEQVTVIEENGAKVLELIASVGVMSFVDLPESFSKFLPENALSIMYVSCRVYLDEISGDSYRTEVNLNFIESTDMDLLNNFISSFTGSNMLDTFSETLGEQMFSSLEMMKDVLNFTIVGGTNPTESALGTGGSFKFDDVFSVIIDNANIVIYDANVVEDPHTRPIDKSELRDVLQSLNGGNEAEEVDSVTGNSKLDDELWNAPSGDDLNEFFLDFEENYYLNEGTFSGKEDGIDGILNGADTFKEFGSTFRTRQATNPQDETRNWYGLLDDTKDAQDLKATLSDRALVGIVNDQLEKSLGNTASGASNLNSAKVLQISIYADDSGESILEMIISAEVEELIGDMGDSFSKLVPLDKFGNIYITSRSYLNQPELSDQNVSAYRTELIINFDESNAGLMSNFIRGMSGGGSDVLDTFKATIGETLYSAIDGFGGTIEYEFKLGDKNAADDADKSGGLTLVPFYKKMAEILGIKPYEFFNIPENEWDGTIPWGDNNKEKQDYEQEFYNTLQGAIQNMHTDVADDENPSIVINEIRARGLSAGDVGGLDGAVVVENDTIFPYLPNKLKLGDSAFGGYLKNDEGGTGPVDAKMSTEILQTSLIALKHLDTKITNEMNEARVALESFFDEFIMGRKDSEGNTYAGSDKYRYNFMAISVVIEFESGIEISSASTILPDKVYATVIINLEGTDNPMILVINEYTALEQKMFFTLMSNAGTTDFGEDSILNNIGKDALIKLTSSGMTYEANESWTPEDSQPLGYFVYGLTVVGGSGLTGAPNGIIGALNLTSILP